MTREVLYIRQSQRACLLLHYVTFILVYKMFSATQAIIRNNYKNKY